MQNYRYRIGAFRLMVMLLGFVVSIGVTSADNSPVEIQALDDSTILPSPRPEPFPADSLEKHPEEKHAQQYSPHPEPLISIIIDDLGYRQADGMRAIGLPGPVTFSIIPYTPYAQRLSGLAHSLGKEILLHMPMEAEGNHYLEPGGLTTRMSRAELIANVHASIASLPQAKGISNHMGSLLTRQVKPMRWLMEAMLQYDKPLYFVDSRTTADTVALITARQYGIPSLKRDVFLDHRQNAKAILAEFHRMILKAKFQGTALGIAHPYPETLDVLEQALGQLEDQGVTLVPVSVLLTEQMGDRQKFAGNMVVGHKSLSEIQPGEFVPD